MSQWHHLNAIQVEYDIKIPMRDGTRLSADIYRPRGDGKWPVIVERDGYIQYDPYKVSWATYFSQHGYVYINNNTRGAFLSEGEFFPVRDDGWGAKRDGYDVVEWAAQQPWSNGKVGMYGCSYGAAVQYLAAAARPPSLKACYPIFGPTVKDVVFQQGVHRLREHRGWALYMMAEFYNALKTADEEKSRQRAELLTAREESVQWFSHLPLNDLPILAEVAPWYFEHLAHDQGDPWWDQMDACTMLAEIDVPILHIGGWYDCYLAGTLAHFSGISTHGRTEATRQAQRLIVGPWYHHDITISPDSLDFGSDAYIGLPETALPWFDYWLKGEANGVLDGPKIRLFLMGENRWLEMDEWPPVDAAYTPLYLHAGSGQSEQSLNNGRLSFETPTPSELPDSYRYDPADPILTLGISPIVPVGVYQQEEGRMLTYTSEPLAKAVVVVGPVKAKLYASSSAPDTDWRVLLCDLAPDGKSLKICDGILRARYRTSFDHEEFMRPGEVYCFEIDMVATAHSFLPGHCIRVDVTSSDFPWLDRNLNTGGPFGEESVGQVAINTIYHDAQRPSHLLLPLMKS